MFAPNCVIVTPSPEISLKSSAVRSFMLNRLKKNMVLNLKHFGAGVDSIDSVVSRLIIPSKDSEKVLSSLKNVFGIKYFSLAQSVSFSTLEDLSQKAVGVSRGVLEGGTFAVRGKSFSKGISSKQLEEEIGRNMLDAFKALKVKLKNPEHELHCLLSKKTAYFFFSYVNGAEGMPIGSQGRAGLIVLSSSIKSDLIGVGKNLLKFGCNVGVVSDSEYFVLKELEEFNNFKPLNNFTFQQAIKLYSEDEISAFFSTAKNVKDAKGASVLVGVKVFAPLLI